MINGLSRPVTGYAYLDAVLDQAGSVLAMAHRGGSGHPDVPGFENTLHAFRTAVKLGYHYLETDVRATRDGVLVACHDATLDRVAGQPGSISQISAVDLSRVRIGGIHEVPTLASLFEELPQCRFNVDIKSPMAIEPLAAFVQQTNAYDRICVGSFSLRSINTFRKLTQGRVATSAAPAEVAAFLILPSTRLIRLATRGRIAVLQVPHRHRGITVVSPALVRQAHAAGAHVHVWTVDEPAEMNELLDLGVDGLITDRTDVLKGVLAARGLWRDHA